MKTQFDDRPIGIFDSGVGGLTVVKEIIQRLPGESIVYFGDTARIPYGTKSEDTVRKFALEDSFFLLDKDVKMIVVACNTASSVAVEMLRDLLDVPVIGVINPGSKAAVKRTKSGKIGVIGTAATIRSESYTRELQKLNPQYQIIPQACPLFVNLVEENWIEDEATYLIARRYLQSIIFNEVDTLILGCTHYPLLKNVLQKITGPSVQLVDSAIETAIEVEALLAENQIFASAKYTPTQRYYLSDIPYKFQDIAERFLKRTIPHVHTVDFEQFLIEKGQEFWKSYQEDLKRVY